MAGNSSYRVRTTPGSGENVLNFNLKHDYDFIDVLSLKLLQKDFYKLYASKYGTLVGRVIANDGFGVPNAKISIFIEANDVLSDTYVKQILYPYKTIVDKNDDGIRYNLLTNDKLGDCHQNVGTMPNKRYVLDNDIILEVFDSYYKYTTVTNSAGDYMFFGLPVGTHQLHSDIDLSDVGILSQRPTDMMYKGYNVEQFDSPSMFKKSTNLDSLPQIISNNTSVYIYPFWGDSEESEVAITRNDINLQYKFEPTCVFMGSIFSDSHGAAVAGNCKGGTNSGAVRSLTTGEGSIEMIRKTFDNRIEKYIIGGDRLIDGNGVWCYQIPMNLDYITTDEFGGIVLSDDPNKGVPTKSTVRFRVTLDSPDGGGSSDIQRASYLVPHNPKNKDDEDYSFDETTSNPKSFIDLYWNKVYSVKNYIPRLSIGVGGVTSVGRRGFLGIKSCNLHDTINPLPFNTLYFYTPFSFTLLCVFTVVLLNIVRVLNWIISVLNTIIQLFCCTGEFKEWGWFGFKVFGKKIGFYLSELLCNSVFLLVCAPIPKRLRGGLDCVSFNSFCGNKQPFAPGCLVKAENQDVATDQDDVTQEIKCAANNLAKDYNVLNYDFYNDWVNGSLYAPQFVVKERKKKKRRFYGIFGTKSVNPTYIEYCGHVNDDGFSYKNLMLVQKCTPNMSASGMTSSNRKIVANDGCGSGCDNTQETKNISVGITTKFIIDERTHKYYYRAGDIRDFKNTIYVLPTDIILLGSLNDCDLDGIPPLYQYLPSTTYNDVPDMVVTDVEDGVDKNGDPTISNISHTDTTGANWSISGADQCRNEDGGLFLEISCTQLTTATKSCINAQRVCELGVTLDESFVRYRKGGEQHIIADGYISKDQLLDVESRQMFATLNGGTNRLESTNKYDGSSYHLQKFYPINFDGRLSEVMGNNQKNVASCAYIKSGISGYYNSYKREVYDNDYYNFRFGLNNNGTDPSGIASEGVYYDMSTHKFPRYENSFYFYFGVKSGLTAIDRFKTDFYSPCVVASEDAFSVKIVPNGKYVLCPCVMGTITATNSGTIFTGTDNSNFTGTGVVKTCKLGERIYAGDTIVKDKVYALLNGEIKYDNTTIKAINGGTIFTGTDIITNPIFYDLSGTSLVKICELGNQIPSGSIVKNTNYAVTSGSIVYDGVYENNGVTLTVEVEEATPPYQVVVDDILTGETLCSYGDINLTSITIPTQTSCTPKFYDDGSYGVTVTDASGASVYQVITIPLNGVIHSDYKVTDTRGVISNSNNCINVFGEQTTDEKTKKGILQLYNFENSIASKGCTLSDYSVLVDWTYTKTNSDGSVEVINQKIGPQNLGNWRSSNIITDDNLGIDYYCLYLCAGDYVVSIYKSSGDSDCSKNDIQEIQFSMTEPEPLILMVNGINLAYLNTTTYDNGYWDKLYEAIKLMPDVRTNLINYPSGLVEAADVANFNNRLLDAFIIYCDNGYNLTIEAVGGKAPYIYYLSGGSSVAKPTGGIYDSVYNLPNPNLDSSLENKTFKVRGVVSSSDEDDSSRTGTLMAKNGLYYVYNAGTGIPDSDDYIVYNGSNFYVGDTIVTEGTKDVFEVFNNAKLCIKGYLNSNGEIIHDEFYVCKKDPNSGEYYYLSYNTSTWVNPIDLDANEQIGYLTNLNTFNGEYIQIESDDTTKLLTKDDVQVITLINGTNGTDTAEKIQPWGVGISKNYVKNTHFNCSGASRGYACAVVDSNGVGLALPMGLNNIEPPIVTNGLTLDNFNRNKNKILTDGLPFCYKFNIFDSILKWEPNFSKTNCHTNHPSIISQSTAEYSDATLFYGFLNGSSDIKVKGFSLNEITEELGLTVSDLFLTNSSTLPWARVITGNPSEVRSCLLHGKKPNNILSPDRTYAVTGAPIVYIGEVLTPKNDGTIFTSSSDFTISDDEDEVKEELDCLGWEPVNDGKVYECALSPVIRLPGDNYILESGTYAILQGGIRFLSGNTVEAYGYGTVFNVPFNNTECFELYPNELSKISRFTRNTNPVQIGSKLQASTTSVSNSPYYFVPKNNTIKTCGQVITTKYNDSFINGVLFKAGQIAMSKTWFGSGVVTEVTIGEVVSSIIKGEKYVLVNGGAIIYGGTVVSSKDSEGVIFTGGDEGTWRDISENGVFTLSGINDYQLTISSPKPSPYGCSILVDLHLNSIINGSGIYNEANNNTGYITYNLNRKLTIFSEQTYVVTLDSIIYNNNTIIPLYDGTVFKGVDRVTSYNGDGLVRLCSLGDSVVSGGIEPDTYYVVTLGGIKYNEQTIVATNAGTIFKGVTNKTEFTTVAGSDTPVVRICNIQKNQSLYLITCDSTSYDINNTKYVGNAMRRYNVCNPSDCPKILSVGGFIDDSLCPPPDGKFYSEILPLHDTYDYTYTLPPTSPDKEVYYTIFVDDDGVRSFSVPIDIEKVGASKYSDGNLMVTMSNKYDVWNKDVYVDEWLWFNNTTFTGNGTVRICTLGDQVLSGGILSGQTYAVVSGAINYSGTITALKDGVVFTGGSDPYFSGSGVVRVCTLGDEVEPISSTYDDGDIEVGQTYVVVDGTITYDGEVITKVRDGLIFTGVDSRGEGIYGNRYTTHIPANNTSVVTDLDCEGHIYRVLVNDKTGYNFYAYYLGRPLGDNLGEVYINVSCNNPGASWNQDTGYVVSFYITSVTNISGVYQISMVPNTQIYDYNTFILTYPDTNKINKINSLNCSKYTNLVSVSCNEVLMGNGVIFTATDNPSFIGDGVVKIVDNIGSQVLSGGIISGQTYVLRDGIIEYNGVTINASVIGEGIIFTGTTTTNFDGTGDVYECTLGEVVGNDDLIENTMYALVNGVINYNDVYIEIPLSTDGNYYIIYQDGDAIVKSCTLGTQVANNGIVNTKTYVVVGGYIEYDGVTITATNDGTVFTGSTVTTFTAFNGAIVRNCFIEEGEVPSGAISDGDTYVVESGIINYNGVDITTTNDGTVFTGTNNPYFSGGLVGIVLSPNDYIASGLPRNKMPVSC